MSTVPASPSAADDDSDNSPKTTQPDGRRATYHCPHCGTEMILGSIAMGSRDQNASPPSRPHYPQPRQPMTVSRAREFVMPFGKFKGMSLDEIATENRAYLEWAVDSLDKPNIVRAIRAYLDLDDE